MSDSTQAHRRRNDLDAVPDELPAIPENNDHPPFQWSEVVWYNVIILASWHLGALYSLFVVMPSCTWTQLSVLWIFFWIISGLGITAGAHRLWSHKSYKATLPLRFILMLWNAMAFQGSIFEWSRDHRVHHKNSDTTADPHDSGRGFFFAHMGWVMVRKHPNVRKEGKKISYDDLLADPVVHMQKAHYMKFVLLMCYVMPTIVGHLLGSAWAGFWVGGIFRHVWVLHMTWMVNSVAHFFGYKPYDPKIKPVENIWVSIGAIGEGYHNYHHKYPTDYATSEWGLTSGQFNPTKLFIDTCASLGLAYDLKKSRTAAMTREKVAMARREQEIKKDLEGGNSWLERVAAQLFFGRSEEELF